MKNQKNPHSLEIQRITGVKMKDGGLKGLSANYQYLRKGKDDMPYVGEIKNDKYRKPIHFQFVAVWERLKKHLLNWSRLTEVETADCQIDELLIKEEGGIVIKGNYGCLRASESRIYLETDPIDAANYDEEAYEDLDNTVRAICSEVMVYLQGEGKVDVDAFLKQAVVNARVHGQSLGYNEDDLAVLTHEEKLEHYRLELEKAGAVILSMPNDEQMEAMQTSAFEQEEVGR